MRKEERNPKEKIGGNKKFPQNFLLRRKHKAITFNKSFLKMKFHFFGGFGFESQNKL